MIVCNVKTIAEARGFQNPRQLSKASGVPYTACYKLWNGIQYMISFDVLEKLCRALRTTPGKLLTLIKSTEKKNGNRKTDESRASQTRAPGSK